MDENAEIHVVHSREFFVFRASSLILQLSWSSYSTAPAVIPASALFYATPISGSPYNVSVVPGAAAYPYTDAYGDGVATAAAGVPASFVIQAKVNLLDLGAVGGRVPAVDTSNVRKVTLVPSGFDELFRMSSSGGKSPCGTGQQSHATFLE